MKPKETKPARLADVAKAAGVSRVAVSHVLNGGMSTTVRVSEATRHRVHSAAKKLNYRPNRVAQALRGARTKTIGVILDTVNQPVMFHRLAALEREASQRGFRLMIGQVHHEPGPKLRDQYLDFLDDFDARGVDGIICLADLMKSTESDLRAAFQNRVNVIFHGRPATGQAACVYVDTVGAARKLVAHLLERGRTRVGLQLYSVDDELMLRRREGYRLEHTARGAPMDERLVWVANATTGIPDPTLPDLAVEALVVQQQADAIIAANDNWAVRIIQRLKARGYRVPHDVAVAGYNNLEICTIIEPSLTTIDQNYDEYARQALDLLMELATGKSQVGESIQRVIEASLIVRDST